jgi:signal transduction histidine kinase
LRLQLADLGKDVQALSHRLHSSKLDYLGLAVAAGSFCREFSHQHEVEVEFVQSSIPRSIPKDTSLSLFRVLQEALQNAVKHSGVRQFKVDLRGTPEQIHLTIRDLGSGFNPQSAMIHGGLGLISMRERLQLVGGQLSINSALGRGTTISARAPLQKQHDRLATG